MTTPDASLPFKDKLPTESSSSMTGHSQASFSTSTAAKISIPELLDRFETVNTGGVCLNQAIRERQAALKDTDTCPFQWRMSSQESDALGSLRKDIESHQTRDQGTETSGIAEFLLGSLATIEESLLCGFQVVQGHEGQLTEICDDHIELVEECTNLHMDWIVDTAKLEASQSGVLRSNSSDPSATINYRAVWNTIVWGLLRSQPATGQVNSSLSGAQTLIKWQFAKRNLREKPTDQDEETEEDKKSRSLVEKFNSSVDNIPSLGSRYQNDRSAMMQELNSIRRLFDTVKPEPDARFQEFEEDDDVRSSSSDSTAR
ncbi:hypothetical protein BCR39DRAFT_508012 [Naematelia encephala]|uniref:Uncharacterized protein n=1 Tax=Naematelia encephala TaxID=71784 RepID=A0A1Y2AJM3_9TREE|nr:hypothetical protein BCR39DRAFT_508012 [Naematelia encephala]